LPGLQANNLTVELVEWGDTDHGNPDASTAHGKLITTNRNTDIRENVIGPADVLVFDQQLNWDESYVIDQLTSTPRVLRYSISLQIAPEPMPVEILGDFDVSSLFTIPGKLSVKLRLRTSELTPDSTIVIKPRTVMHDLVWDVKEFTDDLGVVTMQYGWIPAALRTAVNNDNPWIEMPDRPSKPVATGATPTPPFDQQDSVGIDEAFLAPAGSTFLGGGDGLPATPVAERTGPFRSLVHVNYGELPDGSLAEANTVYEWVGDSATSGAWQTYA
jgi:hypothetical protein